MPGQALFFRLHTGLARLSMGIRVRHANGCHILDPELVSFRTGSAFSGIVKRAAVLVFLALIAAPRRPAEGTNLVANGSFEQS